MKKKSLKRFLALVLTLALALYAAACGQGEEDSSVNGDAASTSEDAASTSGDASSAINEGHFPIVDEAITITVSGKNISTDDWNETDMVAYIADEMGIIMDCTSYEGDDVWKTQMGLMLASDELTDLVINAGTDLNEVAEYGQDGYLLAIDEYLDYAPNLQAFLEENEDYAAMVTSADGHIYSLAQYANNPIGNTDRLFINKNWLENVGMDNPETVDELYEVLKAFKEQDANGNGDPDDEIPLSGIEDSPVFSVLQAAFGLDVTVSGVNYATVLNDDGSIAVAQATENYQAYLAYMNKLYDEGLLDETIFTQDDTALNAKVAGDTVGAFKAAAPFATLGATIDVDQNYYALVGLASDYNPEGGLVAPAAVSSSAKVFISADTEHPEAIVRLLDYFFTDEGGYLSSYGPYANEYVDYEKYSTIQTILPEDAADDYGSAEEYRYRKSVINEALKLYVRNSGKYEYYYDLAVNGGEITDEDIVQDGWLALMTIRAMETGFREAVPNLVYDAEAAEDRTTLLTDIQNYIEEKQAKFIIGEMDPEADWDSYLTKLEEMGLPDLLAIEQAAYDAMFGN